ncbi:helix-turn-helix domain-containing protein [Falsihalocynthiibacter arcticus]|uniref:4-hydroxy-3-methylbut-2-en-1-yl diphosphate synthase n=1 Tax=Falsihalocynthiibacter arcticus TaxID=1579316 RepID=A0A126V269_9RHOB|nr:helix-turn-helix domain-containing protein [Falsihalocynthiibacter arcticus]AML52422.1 4-hydroxy-3-methylbut-2-en-1-yl diphosphate synthase [Falsihalocynthiibacter arcticus]
MIRRILSPKSVKEEGTSGFDSYELRLGDLMRGERATLGKSLLDVQRELKVKATYIAAIENADPLAFETPGFIAGYVRSYARYLGMDPEWAYTTFCVEANFETVHGMSAEASSAAALKAERRARKFEGKDPFANPNASFVPRGEAMLSKIEPAAIGSVAVLIVLIAGLGYGGYSVLQEVQRVQFAPLTEASGVGSSLDPLRGGSSGFSEDVLPTQVTDNASDLPTDALTRLYRPEALAVPVLIARDGPISALSPDAFRSAATVLASNVEAALAAIEESEVQVIAEASPELKIFAVRPAWVRVSAADGTVIFEKILDTGEEFIIPATEVPPMLRAGNSGSVYFGVNGETYGPAGRAGSVASKVVLAQDSLSEAYKVADMNADQDLAKYVALAAVE